VHIVGLDRANQYSRALTMNANALEYWVTRFRFSRVMTVLAVSKIKSEQFATTLFLQVSGDCGADRYFDLT
jgi:hypothetical protein